jgi:hypothetical protein
MPALHAHDDDFLFQIQHPDEMRSPDNPANAFLKRTVSRIRNGRTRYVMCQAPPVSVFWRSTFLRVFKLCWPHRRSQKKDSAIQ